MKKALFSREARALVVLIHVAIGAGCSSTGASDGGGPAGGSGAPLQLPSSCGALLGSVPDPFLGPNDGLCTEYHGPPSEATALQDIITDAGPCSTTNVSCECLQEQTNDCTLIVFYGSGSAADCNEFDAALCSHFRSFVSPEGS